MAIPLIAAALYGMAGWQNNNNRKRTEARQDMDDAWAEKERKRKEQEWDEADQLKIALKDAGAVRTEQQGTITQGQTGGMTQRAFNQNPEEAQRVKGMMDAEAEMTGAAPAMAQPGTAITGKMSRGHQIGQTMGAMGADPNSPEAVAQRTAQAYRQNGQWDKALTMENALMESQLKKLNLTTAQGKFARDEFNRILNKTISSQPTAEDGIAKVLSDTQLGDLKGVTAKYRPSADGKSVEYYGVDAQGKETPLTTLPKGPAGVLAFMQHAGQVDFEDKLNYLVEQAKAERDQANKNRIHELDVTKAKNTNTYQMGMLELNRTRASNAGGDSQGAATGGVSMDAIDKQLQPLFTKNDPVTGAKALDTQALMTVRSLAMSMPAAFEGDATGAALQAHDRYTKALKAAGGSHEKAAQLLFAKEPPTQGQVAPPGVGTPQAGANAMQRPVGSMGQMLNKAQNPAAANQQLALQQQKEDEEMMLGKRRAYSPEIQTIVDAKAKERAKAQAEYLAREQARMLTPR